MAEVLMSRRLDELRHELFMRRCRHDPAIFAAYVMEDRVTRARFQLAPFQRQWYKLAGPSGPRRLVCQAPVNRGKSATFIEAIPIWLLGRMSEGIIPHEAIGIVCVTDDLSDGRVRTLRSYIEAARDDRLTPGTIGHRLAQVFPRLLPDRGRWTGNAFTIQRSLISPDPSVIGGGIGTARFGGKRFSHLIFDDPESEPKLVESPAWRKACSHWTWGQAEGRVERSTGKFWMVGTPGHTEGIMSEAVAQGWEMWRFLGPGLPASEYEAPRTMLAHDPVRWTPEALEEERAKYPAKRYEQLVWLRAFTEADRFFTATSIELMRDLGGRYPMMDAFPRSARKDSELVLAGLDSSSGEGSDDTAIIVSLVGGPVDHTLHLRRGRWGMLDILRQMLLVQRAYDVDYWGSEGNAVQKWLRQAARSPEIMAALGATADEIRHFRVLDTKTGAMDKHDPDQIRGMALDFEAGKRAIQGTAEGEKLLDEITLWTPAGHTGDYLSALWQQEQLKRRMRLSVAITRTEAPPRNVPLDYSTVFAPIQDTAQDSAA